MMPMPAEVRPGARRRRRLASTVMRLGLGLVVLTALAVVADGLVHAAAAQPAFGARLGTSDPQASGVIGWLLDRQSQFYRQISAALRAAKADGDAAWTLLAISFAYGVFHAAGPGHGKAVISSYLIANEHTARRGIVLAFASAMLQALVAVALVGIGAWLLDVTARTMCGAERAIEIASYALIAAFGARLCWTKGRGLIAAVPAARRALTTIPSPTLAPALIPVPEPTPRSVPRHAAAHAAHAVHDHGPVGEAHGGPGHVHDAHCGHNHGPAPDRLAGPGGWQRGLGAIVAGGLRPCSGAILVLVFALAQGLFWAGIAATFVMGLGTAVTVAAIATLAVSAKSLARRLAAHRDGVGALVLRAIEFGAAAIVLVFGAGLLAGYLAAERVTCF